LHAVKKATKEFRDRKARRAQLLPFRDLRDRLERLDRKGQPGQILPFRDPKEFKA
jgi:hypothetical protein